MCVAKGLAKCGEQPRRISTADTLPLFSSLSSDCYSTFEGADIVLQTSPSVSASDSG